MRKGRSRQDLVAGLIWAHWYALCERCHAWLFQQENAGRVFTAEQLAWLEPHLPAEFFDRGALFLG
jgi:hypothetical protein